MPMYPLSCNDGDSQPRIAIIGGGPGRLTRLRKRGTPATFYEREASFTSRAHVRTSRAHRALRENGIEALFKQHSRPEGDSNRFADSQKILGSMDADPNRDPGDHCSEIDRAVLHGIMLDALPLDHTKDTHGQVLASKSARSLPRLEYARAHIGQQHYGGVRRPCAESEPTAARSRVCTHSSPALSPCKYHGVTGAEISLAPETRKLPELQETVEMVRQGSMYAVVTFTVQ